jgi:flagellar biosynthesis chaperone FliJ
MVLVMARREAEPHQRQPKMLKRELENISRKLRDLTENRHRNSLRKSQLTLCQGMVKKGDDIADDDDDDVVSTNVS